MKTMDYLEQVKEKYRLTSDGQLSRKIGVTSSMMSKYRNKNDGMGDEIALRVAELLSIPPVEVLANIQAERTKCPEAKKVWQQAAKSLRATTLSILLVACGTFFVPDSGVLSASELNYNIHYAYFSHLLGLWLVWRFWRFFVPVVALGVAFTSPAFAWSDSDTVREAAWHTLNFIDWRQTLYIADHCQDGGYYEQNPALSRCPSRKEVNRYFAISAITHGLASHYLPADYRKTFQSVSIFATGGTVLHNEYIGLKFKFNI